MLVLPVILIIITSFIFPGIIIRTKSIFSGRKGPGIFQPVKDIWRLFRKGNVYSNTTSFVFKIAPDIYVTSLLVALTLLPFGEQRGIFSFNGDFVFFAYILAVGKFFLIISALDTGSSFEGMGASREALYSMLVEPAFFLLMGSIALLTGYNSFADIYTRIQFGSYISLAVGALASLVLISIAMIENSRMPIDDPKTHLELTMIHEVMILDYSGYDLGLILYGTGLKFAMYGALIANFFISPGQAWYLSVLLFFSIQTLFAIVTGFMESFIARFRLSHNPQYIFSLTAISLLIFFMVLLVLGKLD